MARTPLTEVPYIGDSTERELRRALRGSRPTGNQGKEVSVEEASRRKYREVVQVKLDKRQRKNLQDMSGSPGLLTREEKRQMSDNSGGRTEKSPDDMTGVGDFRVTRGERRDAYDDHQDRSSRARDVDNQRRATITADYDKWASDPSRFDFPGVDTPKRKARIEERDKPFVAPENVRRDVDDESQFGVNLPGFGGGSGGESESQNFQEFTAAVFGNTLSPDRFDIKDDTPGDGSGIGSGTRKEISSMVQEQMGIQPEEADKTSAVAEVTLQFPEDEPIFQATPEIAELSEETDATVWDF